MKKRLIFVMLIFTLAFFALSACDNTTKYTLSLSIEPTQAGTVSGGGDYEAGSEVSITATPNDNYDFEGWYNNQTQLSQSLTYTFIMPNHDLSLVARFSAKPAPTYNLTITTQGEGSVEVIPNQQQFAPNTNVKLIANHNNHTTFSGYFNNSTLLSTENEYQFLMPAYDLIITAIFEPIVQTTYTLEVEIEGEGDVQISPQKQEYQPNESITLTATPNNSTFNGFYKNQALLTQNNTYQFLIDSNTTIKAVFEPIVAQTAQITINSTNKATVTTTPTLPLNQTKQQELHQTLKQIQTDKKPQKQFIGWFNTSTNQLIHPEATTTQFDLTITQSLTIEPRFEQKYLLSITIEGEGIVTVAGEPFVSGYFVQGTQITLTAQANTQNRFIGFYISDTLLSQTSPHNVNINDNKAITAVFKPTYTLTLIEGEGGSIQNQLVDQLIFNQQITLTAIQDDNYRFEGWFDADDKLLSDQAQFSYTMPAQDTTIKAKFVRVYQLNITIEGEGLVVSELTEIYNLSLAQGEAIDLLALSKTDWEFEGWYNDSQKISSNKEYRFVMEQQNVQLTAKFIFVAQTINLNLLSSTGGSMQATNPQGQSISSGEHVVNTKLTLTATNNAGYTFVGWLINDYLMLTANPATLTLPNYNITLQPHFKQIDAPTPTPDTQYNGGDGSQQSPYQINTIAQLLYFANQINTAPTNNFSQGKYYKLTSDLDLNGMEWTPIGIFYNASNTNYTRAFQGHFDGNNKTISNFVITTPSAPALISSGYLGGFFGAILNATIIDLNIKGFVIDTAQTNTLMRLGLLVGYAIHNSTNSYTIKNCTVIGGITTATKGIARIGGLIGDSSDAGNPDDFNISNCNTNVIINADADSLADIYVGGFVGYLGTNVTNSYSYGNISIQYMQDTSNLGSIFAGGFAGHFSSVGANNNSYAQDCYSGVNLEVIRTGLSASSKVTAVGGFLGAGNSNTQGAKNCYSTGNITVASTSAITVGGFVGRDGKFDYCYSSGSVNAILWQPTQAANNNNISVGGFVGELATIGSYAKNCYSSGDVRGVHTNTSQIITTLGTSSSYTAVGGFIGHHANSSASGIMAIIEKCYSTSNVQAEALYTPVLAGGFVGYLSNNYSQISNSLAVGNVSSIGSSELQSFVSSGGFLGYASTIANISNVYSYANQVIFSLAGRNQGGQISPLNPQLVSANTLESQQFYKETLKFDVESWNISQLDFATKALPIFGRSNYVKLVLKPVTNGNVSGDIYVLPNQNANLTATPHDGYYFDGWYVNDSQQKYSDQTKFTMQMPTDTTQITLEARFSPNQNTLTLIVDLQNGGSVDFLINSIPAQIEQGQDNQSQINRQYHTNQDVSILATEHNDYRFEGWYTQDLTLVSSDYSHNFSMPTSDLTLIARFVLAYSVQIIITVDGEQSTQAGEVSGNQRYPQGNGKYTPDELIELQLNLIDGYKLNGWYFNDQQTPVSTSNTLQFNMPSYNLTIYVLTESVCMVTLLPVQLGTATLNEGMYKEGDTLQLLATPNQGYMFTGWYNVYNNQETLLSTQSSYTLTVGKEFIEIEARFAPLSYTITLNTPTNGGAQIQDPKQSYAAGSTITILVAPSIGYTFNGLYNLDTLFVGSDPQNYLQQYTFTMPHQNLDLTAKFIPSNTTYLGEAFENGDGTESNPFQISTAQHLIYLSNRVNMGLNMLNNNANDYQNMHFVLTNNIDLNGMEWTPIGYLYQKTNNYTRSFRGVFDGANYTISNYKITKITHEMSGAQNQNDLIAFLGLFGAIGGSSSLPTATVPDPTQWTTIKNLTLKGFDINITSDTGNVYAGGLFGYRTNSYCVIDNVSTSGKITINSTKVVFVGGVFGNLDSEIITQIKNCNSNVDIKITAPLGNSAVYVGGIGASYSPITDSQQQGNLLENCWASGNIEMQLFNGSSTTGGLLGRINTTSGNRYATLKNCYSTSSIKINTIGEIKVGGLVGSSTQTIASYTNCYSTSNINAHSQSSNTLYAGGIVGASYSCTIQKSYHKGNIYLIANDISAGGILGANSGSTDTISIQNCYSQTDIYASFNLTSTYKFDIAVGGIMGLNKSANASIANCYSSGNIYSATSSTHQTNSYSTSSGGILGYAESSISITASFALGNIRAFAHEGIVFAHTGYIYAQKSATAVVTLNKCYANQDLNSFTKQTQGDPSSTPTQQQLCTLLPLQGFTQQIFNADNLNWNTTIWNIQSIDFAWGIYPSLNNI